MRRHISILRQILIAVAIGSALLASTALGAPRAVTLVLNTVNTARALTTLTASLAGPALQIVNTGTGAALGLEVPAGQAPMAISAGAGKVANLDADKLDGRDASEFAAAPLFVRVNAGGTIAVSHGVTSVSKSRFGYVIVFDRNVENCVAVASPADNGTSTLQVSEPSENVLSIDALWGTTYISDYVAFNMIVYCPAE